MGVAILIYALDGLIEVVFEGDDSGVAFDGVELQNVSDLFEVLILMFPDKEEGDSFEGVDEGEEEVVDEEVVVDGTELVEGGHDADQDLAKLILAGGANAGILEETDEQFHHFTAVLHQNT